MGRDQRRGEQYLSLLKILSLQAYHSYAVPNIRDVQGLQLKFCFLPFWIGFPFCCLPSVYFLRRGATKCVCVHAHTHTTHTHTHARARVQAQTGLLYHRFTCV